MSAKGRQVRVVSLPSWEIFEEQSEEYRNEVLPVSVTRRLSVEAGISMGWERYLGPGGRALSINSFGASAPADKLFTELGFTAENIAALVEQL